MAGPSLPDPVDFSAGEVHLGPYRLLRPISAGGMARVYEGRLDSLAGVTTRVAVKVIHPDFANEAAFQDLFISEARISARLEHQNLVRIQQFNREGGLYYLVMEYIDGITFRKIISMCRKHRMQLPVQVIAELGRQVCEGLHYAHNLMTETGEPLHLVHRDVKPSNLMLNAHGVAKVLDFGISSAHGTVDHAGAVKGTWGYMSLEQADAGAVGPAADVFGLGAVLYELAALEPLFGEKENAVIRQRLLEDVAAARAAALGGAYADLGGVLVRALQRDPSARHRSAAVFGRALSTLVVDPVGVHDLLVRLFRDLRNVEGAPPSAQAVPAAEKPRSMPTMSRAGIGSPRIEPPPALPVRFGDKHGAGRPPRVAAPPPRPAGRLAAPLAAGGLLTVTLAVLGFATWSLVFGSPPRPGAADPPVATPTPGLELLVGDPPTTGAPAPTPSAGGAGTAAAGGTPATNPVSPGAVAPAATTSVAGTATTPAATTTPNKSTASNTPRTPPTGTGSTTGASTSGTATSSAAPKGTRAPTEAPTRSTTPADPDAPVRITAPATSPSSTAPATTPTTSASTPATTSTSPETKRGEGVLTLSSMPRAQVMIDGQYVRYTPLYQYAVSAGTHSVLLVAEDGRRKSFKVDVQADAETRRIWNFDEERWQ